MPTITATSHSTSSYTAAMRVTSKSTRGSEAATDAPEGAMPGTEAACPARGATASSSAMTPIRARQRRVD